MTNRLALIVITISTLLMQIHGIPFWMEHAGSVGIAWSLAIEGVALWFWFTNRNTLAVIASALLIAGPLHQLSAPLLDGIQTNRIESKQITDKEVEIDQLARALDQYLTNSDKRIGWASRIDNAQTQLNTARADLAALRTKAIDRPNTQRLQAIIALQVAVLIIVMTAQILAVRDLRQQRIETLKRNRISAPQKTETAQPTTVPNQTGNRKASANEVANALRAAIERSGFSQNQWADTKNISRKKVSQILNHERLKHEGKETASKAAFEEVVQILKAA